MNLNKGHALIAGLSICLSLSVGTNIKTNEEHKKLQSKYEEIKGSYDDIYSRYYDLSKENDKIQEDLSRSSDEYNDLWYKYTTLIDKYDKLNAKYKKIAKPKKSTAKKSSNSNRSSSNSSSNSSNSDDSSSSTSYTVYITDYGQKYHAAGCRYLKKIQYQYLNQKPYNVDIQLVHSAIRRCKNCGYKWQRRSRHITKERTLNPLLFVYLFTFSPFHLVAYSSNAL